MPGVEVPVGIKNAAFKRGLDEMRGQAKSFQREIGGSNPLGNIGAKLGAALSLGGIVAGLEGLIQKYSKLEEMSQKFGTSAVTLQKLGGAAKLDDIEVGALAKTMAKLTVAADKAAKSTKEHGDKFKALGIDAKSFAALDMDQKLVALSAAFQRANADGEGAHKMLGLLGARGAAIIPLLARGPEKLNEEMAKTPALGDAAVRQMKALGDIAKETGQIFTKVGLGIADFMRDVGANIGGAINTIRYGRAEAQRMYDEQRAEQKQELEGKEEMKQTGAGAVDADDAREQEEEEKTIAHLREEIAKREREVREEALDDEARLNDIYKERDHLLSQANDTDEDGLKAKRDALELDQKAQKLSEEMNNKSEARAKKQAELEMKHADAVKTALAAEAAQDEKNAMAGMTPDAKAAYLRKKAAKLGAKAKKLEDAADLTAYDHSDSAKDYRARMKEEASKKRLQGKELLGEIADLERKDDAKEEKKAKRSPQVFASSLAETGGGGHAAAFGVVDRQLQELKAIRAGIAKLVDGKGGRTPAPVPTPAFSGDLHRGSTALRTGHL